jgi:hypothetical protein
MLSLYRTDIWQDDAHKTVDVIAPDIPSAALGIRQNYPNHTIYSLKLVSVLKNELVITSCDAFKEVWDELYYGKTYTDSLLDK